MVISAPTANVRTYKLKRTVLNYPARITAVNTAVGALSAGTFAELSLESIVSPGEKVERQAGRTGTPYKSALIFMQILWSDYTQTRLAQLKVYTFKLIIDWPNNLHSVERIWFAHLICFDGHKENNKVCNKYPFTLL